MFFIPGLKICGRSRAIEFSRLLYGLIVIISSKSDCHTLGAFCPHTQIDRQRKRL